MTTRTKMGRLLLKIRAKRGMTQIQMAEALKDVPGLQQAHLSAMEHGRFHPSAGQMEHVLRVLSADRRECGQVLMAAAAEVVR